VSDDLIEVRLLGLPIELHRRAAQHFDGLRREFALIVRSSPDAVSVPRRLLDLIAELEGRFADAGRYIDAQLAQARDEGMATW